MKPDHIAPPLTADDPRLSAWIDGRLPAAEAAEIARAVAASPELSRLAADLRGIKKSLASLPASPPPATFVGAVMAALDATAGGRADDAAVEAEWRKIERERLEEEIAEASDDAAAPVDEPMRHRWPWLAMAGALAAGLLTAFVINRPSEVSDREVALVAPRQREQRTANRTAAEARPGGEKTEKDAWLPEVAAASESGPADPGTAADRGTDLVAGISEPRVAAERHELERVRARSRNMSEGKVDGAPEFGPGRGTDALAAQAPFAPPAALAAPAAARSPGAGGGGGSGGGQEPQVRSVTYRIRTAADRQRLESLLAASGGETGKLAKKGLLLEGSDGRKAATDEAGKRRTVREADTLRRGPGAQSSERITVVGPADAMARLVAALEAAPAPAFAAKAEADRQQSGQPKDLAAVPAPDGQTEITLVIEVVDESAAAVQADEGGQ